jgi:sodium-dependent dicarboxylate transporter 2/3/5
MTEVTSNTAISTLLMPILAATATSTGTDARLLMIPAALSASCAFMLPVATVPNAVVFGTNRIPIREMARYGLRLNLLGALAITVICSVLL